MYSLEERIEDLLGPSRSHGVNRMYKCPWHEERHASLSINMEEGMFFCFGCGKKGNYDTLCHQFGEEPDDEYRWERAKRSIEQDYSRPVDFSPLANAARGQQGREDFQDLLRGFIDARGIGRSVPETFGLYVTDGPRIAFPYADVDGRIVGIKYRDQKGNKSAESGSSFHQPFGLEHAVGRSDVFIFEGESDTLRGYTELGQTGSGICGTSGVGVSEAQWVANGLHLLFARRIFLVYDADVAGDKCAETALRVLGDDKCIRLRPTRGKDFTDHMMAGGTIREMVQ
jgi:DNA primase